MKITSVQPIPLSIPICGDGNPKTVAGAPWVNQEIMLVRIETDDGLIGYGEAFCYIPGLRRTLVAVIEDMIAPLLVGQNASDIAGVVTGLQKTIYAFGRYGVLMAAISGVDIALWDLAGKASKQPLWRLLGGYKDKLASSASLLRTRSPEVLQRQVEDACRAGFRAIKIHERDLECVAAARKAAGNDVRLSVDINCEWDFPYAREALRQLAEYNPLFIEDPLWPPENLAGLARLRSSSGIKIATGGTSCTAWEFQRILDAQAADYCQPSVTVIGGVSEVLKVASLAPVQNAALSLHTPYFGPGLLASLHLAATLAMPNEFERPFYKLEVDLYGRQFDAVDGFTPVPSGPGLGADPDKEVLARYRIS